MVSTIFLRSFSGWKVYANNSTGNFKLSPDQIGANEMEKKLIFNQADTMYAIAGSGALTAILLLLTF